MTAPALSIPILPGKPPAGARVYRPYGAARDLLYAREPEVLIEGPTGTGKTTGVLEKIHLLASKYAGIRVLICRKTRESCTESVLVTYEDQVLDTNSPIKAGPDRAHRQRYTYPNGSTLVIGGLDKSSRIMSTQYDLIYVPEATEIDVADWEALTTRNRHFRLPYQQMIADCNPDKPTHWLNQRAAAGGMRRLLSRHEDNPVLWDSTAHTWTDAGRTYLATLGRLTGPRLLRFLKGIWAAAEGLVYEFDPAIHMLDAPPAGIGWRVTFATADWGYTNPGCLDVWSTDGDGRLYLRAEVYETGHTLDWWVAEGLTLRDRFGITRWIGDGAEPGHIRTFTAAGMPMQAANKDIRVGVGKLQDRLVVAADGRPRFFVLADALIRRDETLAARKLPVWSREEVDGYVWPKGADGKPLKEVPIDADNHGMDCWRYAVMDLDGPRRGGGSF